MPVGSTWSDRGYSARSQNNSKGSSKNPYVIRKDTPAEQRNITTKYLPSDGGQRIVQEGKETKTVQIVTLKPEAAAKAQSIAGEKRTVISGRPDIKQAQATQAAAYTITIQGPIDPYLLNKGILAPSSYLALQQRTKEAERLKGPRISLTYPLKAQDYIQKGGPGTPSAVERRGIREEFLTIDAARPLAKPLVTTKNNYTENIFPKKSVSFRESPIGKGIEEAGKNLLITPLAGIGQQITFLREDLPKGPLMPYYSSLRLATSTKKQSEAIKLSKQPEFQSAVFLEATAPFAGVGAVRWVFGGLGVGSAIKTIKEKPTTAGVTEGLIYGGLGVSSVPKYNLLTRSFMKLSPKYRGVKATGISYVEDVTTPTKLSDLRTFENKVVPTTHVTLADLPKEFITTAQTTGAGPFRTKYKLFDFYKAAPKVGSLKRQAYLGYAGIVSAESTAPSSGKIIFGEPKITILIFNDLISPTPRGFKTIESAQKFQVQTTGKTYIPPENIAGRSMEGQFITPSAYGDRGISQDFFGPKAFDTGLGVPTPGSKIVQYQEQRTFTFYPQRKENILTQAINFIKTKSSGKELSKESLLFKGLATTRFYKLKIVPAETKPVIMENVPSSVKRIDVNKYAKEQAEISSAKRIESPSGFISPSRLLTRTSSGKIVSKSSVSYTPSGYVSSLPSKSMSLKSSSISSSVSSSLSSGISSSLTSSSGRSSSSRISSSLSSSVSSSLSSGISSSLSSSISRISSSPSSSIPIISYPSRSSPPYKDSSKSLLSYSVQTISKTKKKKIRFKDTGLYVLPDLFNVELTERKYALTTGEQAIAPRLTSKIKAQAFSAFKGYGPGYIITEQQRRRLLK